MTSDKVSIMLCFRALQLTEELSALPAAPWGQMFSLILLAWLVSSSDIQLAFKRHKYSEQKCQQDRTPLCHLQPGGELLV